MANLRLPTKYDQKNIQNQGDAAMLLERIFHLLVSEEKLERAIYKINNGGDMEDIDTIVNAYFRLAKKMYRKNLHFFRKPKTVELTDSSMVIRIDGETYDFGFIPHNDLRGTGWKMDIEVLYSTDKMRGIVQERLSEKVAREW
ncbi:hypothetical protein C7256_19215 [Enterocloster lavalensis]|nr:hypothetical protein C7256_19215 [Enterocloster lavalensis]